MSQRRNGRILPYDAAMTRDRDVDTDGLPRATKLYGAIDPHDVYPPTVVEALEELPIAPPLSGELRGRYRIGDVIGRGGMGEVISARDEQIGRSVAIKRLRVANPSPDIHARFLREARIQGRLEHPAVVPVHEVWTDDHGQPFFVMKQLTGVTLADVIARRDASEQYGRARLLRAFAEVCLAIEFAHTRGVVHRDLKPANIVLGDFGEVYVLDWGIARVAGDGDSRASFADIDTIDGTQTVAGAILGTPGYISPEQIRGDHDLDPRADVYALGCILFEILTFEPLHPRGQPALASALTGADARASLRTPDRDIPPELDAICVRATAADRRERYVTARQLGDVVQRFLDGNRDIALRKELAGAELAAAHYALAEGAGASHRRDAIRAAARALALDPTAREAADLVGRLMLEPPKEMPPEVERELLELDLVNLRVSARFGLFAAIAYLVFFPILYWIGFRDLWYHAVGISLCIAIIYAEAKIAPRDAFLSGYIAITGNLLVFALFSWMVSPTILGPGPATIMVMLMATHRTLIRPTVLAILTALALLSPWLLAQVGLASPVAGVDGSSIVLHTAAQSLGHAPTLFALGLYLVALIALAALLGHLQEDDRRSVRRAMQLQSWQLRQLVPTT